MGSVVRVSSFAQLGLARIESFQTELGACNEDPNTEIGFSDTRLLDYDGDDYANVLTSYTNCPGIAP